MILEVEATLKLARYLVFAGRRQDASDQLLAAHALAANLSKTNKLALHVDVTQLYAHMGHHRRAAYFLRETALLHSKAFHHATAHQLLRLACAHFHLPLQLQPPLPLASALLADTDRSHVRGRQAPSGWPALQRQLLKGLIEVARNANGTLPAFLL